MKIIGQCDIKEIAEMYGTPLYVYDKQQIISNYNKLKTAFRKHYTKTEIHYAVKANSNIHLLELFNELGSGVDCSSPIELFLAKKAGFDRSNIMYTGNYESIDELKFVIAEDVIINLDDINSLKRLLRFHTPERVSFRINPGIGRGGFEGIVTAGSDAKFGVPYEKGYEAYKMAKDAGVKHFGIHMMTGSNNLEPYHFVEIVDKLMNIAGDIFTKLEIVPDYIDIGGGFGIPYTDEEEDLNIELTAKLVCEIFHEKCEKYNFGEPHLKLEPGRYLVGNAGYLITEVTGIKESYKTFVGVNGGMNTLLRPSLYGAFHRAYVYGDKANSNYVNLCGQICENSDIFARHLHFPEVEEGDLVILRDVGAYGYVMASNYNNRLRPAEVFVDGNTASLIRRKEKIEDILNLYEENSL
ncbi:MAG: diaminopimelate decarboxylase [Candidatus Cloacimonetes bacterium]|nr:diaminopimelate decarboxylase [Candidatus Cloacimonadota bacterium]